MRDKKRGTALVADAPRHPTLIPFNCNHCDSSIISNRHSEEAYDNSAHRAVDAPRHPGLTSFYCNHCGLKQGFLCGLFMSLMRHMIPFYCNYR